MRTVPPFTAATGARRRLLTTALVVAGGLALLGCREPVAGPATDGIEAEQAPLGAEAPDPRLDVLATAHRDLVASVTVARDALARGVDATTTTQAAQAARDALAALIAGRPGAPDDARPLFPAETVARGSSAEVDDQLTITVTAARDAGGDGRALLDVVRDGVAGDLGAWQRDPAGVLASITETVAGRSGVDDLDAAISELPGLGTRAVAYAELTARATNTETARALAERGVAHLDVILAMLDNVA